MLLYNFLTIWLCQSIRMKFRLHQDLLLKYIHDASLIDNQMANSSL